MEALPIVMATSPWIWMPFSAAQPTTAPDEELERCGRS